MNFCRMDAAYSKQQQDPGHHRIPMCAVVLLLLCASATKVQGQVARIAPQQGEQQIEIESLTANGPQPFPVVQWRIQNAAFRRGCVVQWSAETFRSTSDSSMQADCDISVEVDGGTRPARWTVTKAFDATDLSVGKNTATVDVSSVRRGNARVNLQLRFLHTPGLCLAGGTYQTTLTGTITGL